MNSRITNLLTDIEVAYYEGEEADQLNDRIHRVAALIASLPKADPVRALSETYAPLLWGASSGTAIKTGLVKRALAGSNGPTHLRSWSGLGRALSAYETAA